MSARALLHTLCGVARRTFIFPDVFQRKRQARIFPLHDADFAKRALADDSEELEVVELDCDRNSVSMMSVDVPAPRSAKQL